jgi:hypothetical protein
MLKRRNTGDMTPSVMLVGGDVGGKMVPSVKSVEAVLRWRLN